MSTAFHIESFPDGPHRGPPTPIIHLFAGNVEAPSRLPSRPRPRADEQFGLSPCQESSRRPPARESYDQPFEIGLACIGFEETLQSFSSKSLMVMVRDESRKFSQGHTEDTAFSSGEPPVIQTFAKRVLGRSDGAYRCAASDRASVRATGRSNPANGPTRTSA